MSEDPEKSYRAIEVRANVAAVAVAVLALILGLVAEVRNQYRFQQQLDESKVIAEAQVKPLITVYPTKYTNKKGVTLVNRGVGAAVITKVLFSRDGFEPTASLKKLFDLNEKFYWDTYYGFSNTRLNYVAAGQSFELVLITEEKLIAQGLSKDVIAAIFEGWDTVASEISVHVEYQDMLGNTQDAFERSL